MAPFSKQMLFEDFGAGMEDFGSFFSCLVGESGVSAAFGSPPDKGWDAKTLSVELPGVRLISDAYDFAFEGRLRPGVFRDESEEMIALVGLFRGLQLAVEEFAGSRFNLCVRTMNMAHRRRLLEGSLAFTSQGVVWNRILLTELAELAGVDEKTLRNMASPKHPARLMTEKMDGRTYVPLAVAIPWLAARGFKPTVYEDFRAERNFVADGFFSVLDLAEYIAHAERRMAVSREEFTKLLGEPGDADQLRRIEEGVAPADDGFVRRLAEALAVRDVEDFVKSVLALQDTPYALGSQGTNAAGVAP